MRKGYVVVISAVLGCVALGAQVSAQTVMPVEQQNALVQKHCAVCHNDTTNNGGLTLQHFNAAAVAPSLAAMMLSKLTSGLPLDTVTRASSDPTEGLGIEASARWRDWAAGIAPPDQAITFMLATTLAAQAKNATNGAQARRRVPGAPASIASASVLREVRRRPDMAESYRLVLGLRCGFTRGIHSARMGAGATAR